MASHTFADNISRPCEPMEATHVATVSMHTTVCRTIGYAGLPSLSVLHSPEKSTKKKRKKYKFADKDIYKSHVSDSLSITADATLIHDGRAT